MLYATTNKYTELLVRIGETKHMQENDPYLAVNDIAEKLNIPVPMVWRLIRDKEIVAHRIGKYYRIAPADFEKYLERTRTTHIKSEEETLPVAC